MSKGSDFGHIPVMLEQVVACLSVRPDGCYVDCTLGGGGHAAAILAKLNEKGRFLGLDRDPEALAESRDRLQKAAFSASWQCRQANFSQLADILDELGWTRVDGILADLGVSSWQIDQPERGFTYREEGPLDMRMDPSQKLKAAELVNQWSEQDLTRILRDYGEERYAKRISHAIVTSRKEQPFQTTKQLAELVIRAMPTRSRKEDQHPARRTFQALRIAVNGELEALEKLLQVVPDYLADHGRLVILTFHSLEDRLVKTAMRHLEQPCTCPRSFPVCVCGKKTLGHVVHKRGLVADAAECHLNPRASSARLRCFERAEIPGGGAA